MSELKATPGPWEWSDQYLTSINEKTWSLIGPEGYGILSCDGESNSPQCLGGIGEANAHLIAAAPELYEALLRLVYSPYREGTPSHKKLEDDGKAALAKARGET